MSSDIIRYFLKEHENIHFGTFVWNTYICDNALLWEAVVIVHIENNLEPGHE